MDMARGRRILLMGRYLLVDAEHRTEFAAGRINQGARVDLDFDMNARLIIDSEKAPVFTLTAFAPALPRS
jgi:hypothetical protein